MEEQKKGRRGANREDVRRRATRPRYREKFMTGTAAVMVFVWFVYSRFKAVGLALAAAGAALGLTATGATAAAAAPLTSVGAVVDMEEEEGVVDAVLRCPRVGATIAVALGSPLWNTGAEAMARATGAAFIVTPNGASFDVHAVSARNTTPPALPQETGTTTLRVGGG